MPQAEFTSIAFDVAREQVLLDRTHSGASVDCDVRAGPWPWPPPTADTSVKVHIYVDHEVVELIAFSGTNSTASRAPASLSGVEAVESTAISAWVQPTSVASDGVGLWSEAEGVRLESMDVWQLMAPSHSSILDD